MSLEARVDILESKVRNQDDDMHSLAKVVAEIKNITLANQHDIAGLKASIAALAEATLAGFKRVDARFKEVDARFEQVDAKIDRVHKDMAEFKQENRERFEQVDARFDQLELLIRQRFPSS
ncbi:MAG: hypothetical protein ACR2PT_03775 [Endozoicomonas sp.]